MSCVSRSFGPINPVEPSVTRSVLMTPSEVRVGDEVLLRHGAQTKVQSSGDLVTYTHTDFNPVATITREYTLRAGELVTVRWGAQAGGSGGSTECLKQ